LHDDALLTVVFISIIFYVAVDAMRHSR
jgi:hypothetical protein